MLQILVNMSEVSKGKVKANEVSKAKTIVQCVRPYGMWFSLGWSEISKLVSIKRFLSNRFKGENEGEAS